MTLAAVVGVLIFVLAIAVSIGLHEVGHLVPAKRYGVKVTQYMIGFGPTLWSRRRGETEYGVKAIPLGGYIRMIGMFPPRRNDRGEVVLSATTTGPLQSMIEDARRISADEVQPGDERRVFYRLSVPKKLVVMLGGPTMNLVLAALLFTVALAGLGVAQLTPTVAEVIPCVLSGEQRDCAPDAPEGPAAAAGLQAGDTVIAFEGVPVESWEALQDQVRAAGGETVTLSVERDGQVRDVEVDVASTTRPDRENPDVLVTAGFIGVVPTVAQVRLPLTAVPERMWDFATLSGRAVLSIPQKMVGVGQTVFGNGDRDPRGPVSVVGVGRFSAEVADQPESLSWRAANLLILMASLNMALFLFNLIPLLPLDGGHVAGALYEGARRQAARVRGRPDPGPVDIARLLPVAYGVAIILISMSALLIYADIVKPIQL